jgi:anthranilate phosphoribosyltransferase
MKAILNQLFSGKILSQSEAENALHTIVRGEVTPEEIGAFLGALRMRGEKPEEIAGFARALRAQMITVDFKGSALDTCGTGGDGGKSFNISTAVALILAALDVNVVKHGNRAVSSSCGSADI